MRFDSTPAPFRPDRYKVLSVPEGALQVPHARLFWRAWADSLEFAISTGYAGTTTRLVRDGTGWQGRARTASDVVGTLRYERTVWLVPADCSSPPPVPADADARLLRSVPFGQSLQLTLGERIPSAVSTSPRRSGALNVAASPSDEFSGADTVVVVPASGGLVQRIELRYPAGADLSGLLDRLRSEYGPGESFGLTAATFWRNRTTTVFLQLGARPRFVLEDPRLLRRQLPN